MSVLLGAAADFFTLVFLRQNSEGHKAALEDFSLSALGSFSSVPTPVVHAL